MQQRKELECETEYDKVCNDKKDGYKGKKKKDQQIDRYIYVLYIYNIFMSAMPEGNKDRNLKRE